MKTLLTKLLKWALLALVLFLVSGASAQDAAPAFSAWVDCIERGPYAGRAIAAVSYRYDGEFPIQAEDSRFFGDTETGETITFPFSVQPGEHSHEMRLNVGAFKVVTWKVILANRLYVVTAWNNPEIPDCQWIEPTLEPPETANI